MTSFFRVLILVTGLIITGPDAYSDRADKHWRLAIHGGAGVISPDSMTPEQEARYHEALEAALKKGANILRKGGSSVDAVEAAVVSMENSPLFNAGRGAVFTEAGEHELDAAIMSGRDRDAGAVAGVRRVKNPIRAARAVMEHSPHVMFAGRGADDFAREQGLRRVSNSYFDTDRRRQSLEHVLESRHRTEADKSGTVGAIAIDVNGDVAAATSTGGMTAKASGRVGDTPLIGASTYAQNGVCAVSSTGHGEYFIRVGVAKTICALIELKEMNRRKAAHEALGQVAELGGTGGVIVMDGRGRVAMVFNSEGMYRGVIDAGGWETESYGDG